MTRKDREIIDRVEDLSPDDEALLRDSIVLLGRKAREWRAYAFLHSVSLQLMSADGPVAITCGPDDRVSMRIAGQPSVDITDLIERVA